jgi:hypothetical protein
LSAVSATPQYDLAVIGAGYVGVPLAATFGEAGQRVLLVDVQAHVVDALNRGESHIEDVSSERLAALTQKGLVVATSDYEQLNAWPRKRWHALGANLYPSEQELFEGDLGQLIREYVIPGWAPEEPLLGIDDSVYTLGSCFARELLRYLTKAGVSSKRVWIPSGLNNSFAILDFFSWCATGRETGRGFRYDRLESGEIVEW